MLFAKLFTKIIGDSPIPLLDILSSQRANWEDLIVSNMFNRIEV